MSPHGPAPTTAIFSRLEASEPEAETGDPSADDAVVTFGRRRRGGRDRREEGVKASLLGDVRCDVHVDEESAPRVAGVHVVGIVGRGWEGRGKDEEGRKDAPVETMLRSRV